MWYFPAIGLQMFVQHKLNTVCSDVWSQNHETVSDWFGFNFATIFMNLYLNVNAVFFYFVMDVFFSRLSHLRWSFMMEWKFHESAFYSLCLNWMPCRSPGLSLLARVQLSDTGASHKCGRSEFKCSQCWLSLSSLTCMGWSSSDLQMVVSIFLL